MQIAVERPVAVTMVMLGVVVFGWISYARLPLNLMPEMNHPRLTIRTEYPGSTPEEVEQEISRPVEEILGTVGHLQRMESRSRAGMSEVVIEFSWRASMELAMQEVREKLDVLRLPEEAKKPVLLRYDPNLEPMMILRLSGRPDLFRLRRYAEDVLRPALETLPGVAAVKIRGGLEREVEVALLEKRLSGLGLTIGQVAKRLGEENMNLAGGRLREGNTHYWVRTLSEFSNLEEMKALRIAERDGKPIFLRDIARLQFRPKDPEVITRHRGKPCIALLIYREANANLVEISKMLRKRIFGTAEQQAYVLQLLKNPKKGNMNSLSKAGVKRRFKRTRGAGNSTLGKRDTAAKDRRIRKGRSVTAKAKEQRTASRAKRKRVTSRAKGKRAASRAKGKRRGHGRRGRGRWRK
ncbi:MAG: efflux RND transporter permease subunit, partial [Myxococcota bacterium]